MKKLAYAAIAMMAVLSSCEVRHPFVETDIASYADSTELVLLGMDIELPKAVDEGTMNIRRDLLDILGHDFETLFYDEAAADAMAVTDSLDTEAIVLNFGKAVSASLNALAQDDEDMRMQENDIDAHDFQWDCVYNLKKFSEEDGYVVFMSEMYQYMGGAHGGITGSGYLTYSKEDGSRLTGILDTEKLEEMQPLLRQGIVSYFRDCGEEVPEEEILGYLFVEDGIIPFPEMEPYPTSEGLSFLYNQYEIGAYVIGMPQFTIPYDEVRPYVTAAARKVLGL